MAVTQNRRYNFSPEKYDQNTGLVGVSQNTRNRQAQAQQAYQPSQAVQSAQQQMQAAQAQKPGPFTYTRQGLLDNLYDQVMGQKDFKYDLNGDMLYQQAKDQYVNLGKQAMRDTAANAASLTGGYGNSYGVTAASQAYQQYLTQLAGLAPDYASQAYQRDQGDKQLAMQRLGAAQDDRAAALGEYNQQLAAWQNDRDYATGRYDTEAERDRAQYDAERAYWDNLAARENGDYWQNEQFSENQYQFDQNQAEQIRQYDASLAEEQRQYDRDNAIGFVGSILANGQMPSDELLAAAGLSRADAERLMTVIMADGGSGGGGGGGRGGSGKAKTAKGLAGAADAVGQALAAGGSGNQGLDGMRWDYAQLIENADRVAQSQGYPTMNAAMAAEERKATTAPMNAALAGSTAAKDAVAAAALKKKNNLIK